MKRIVLALALFAGAVMPARAYFMDGDDLLRKCTAPQETHQGMIDNISCLGYVAGVSDALGNIAFCVPAGTRKGELRDMAIVHLLSTPPESRDSPARFLLINAWQKLWPCPSKSK